MFNDSLHKGNYVYLIDDVSKKRFEEATKNMRTNSPKGSFYVYGHGNPGTISQTNKDGKLLAFYNENTLPKLLKENGYTNGQPLVLFSCSTGLPQSSLGLPSLAQLLSNILNVDVYAPDGYLLVPNNGQAYISTYGFPPMNMIPLFTRYNLKKFSPQ